MNELGNESITWARTVSPEAITASDLLLHMEALTIQTDESPIKILQILVEERKLGWLATGLMDLRYYLRTGKRKSRWVPTLEDGPVEVLYALLFLVNRPDHPTRAQDLARIQRALEAARKREDEDE